jgi:asparagine synthase (glutamine-hydrolysing)
MCGIVGVLGGNRNSEVDLRKMTDSLIHRGPNDSGIWCDRANQISLGHRRLSIVDLTSAGHQPMLSQSGRFVLSFNGEIYNHLQLRELLGNNQNNKSSNNLSVAKSWNGHSDTETLLAGFEQWGIRATIDKVVGMFAIGLWDRQTKTLTLIRDRVGEKPLYYGWQGDSFLFGSELKSLRLHPSFQNEIDRNALCLYMRHSYVPAPYTIYKGLCKLNPGCMVTISLSQPEPQIATYWSATQVAEAGSANTFKGSPEEAVNQLEVLLKNAVKSQMISDVPIGAFLSGGIDSSTIVALMQAQSSKPVKTFTIGFNEKVYNEAIYAKVIAKHLNTEHTELYVSSEQAMAVIPQLPTLYCEPFSDSSQIPTFLISKLAREHVTVSLSGDAGDELFCGYTRYSAGSRHWKKISKLPMVGRKIVSKMLTGISAKSWNRIISPFQTLMPRSSQFSNIGEKLHRGAGMLSSKSTNELYLRMVSHWNHPNQIVLGGSEPHTIMNGNDIELKGLTSIQRMMVLDLMTYLPDDILVKVDRAAMGVSLESRVPFLDHRVVEFAWRLPMEYKLRNGETKWALRQVLYKYVPKTLIERPKMGFSIPLDSWLRGPLRDWAEALLSEDRLKREGFFNSTPIREKWLEHLSGKRNWQNHLWDVLMFQSWLEHNK